MPLKKAERKERFTQIIKLMMLGKNKQAFDELRGMCGQDTGLFIMVNYDEAMAELAKREEKDNPVTPAKAGV